MPLIIDTVTVRFFPRDCLHFIQGIESYETHSAVKRPNAVLCKRMRSATDESKSNNCCMQKHKRERRPHYFYSEHYRVRFREIEKV